MEQASTEAVVKVEGPAQVAEEEVPTGPTVDHATYIGGSDIGAVCGVSPYSTALEVWAEKTHTKAPFEGNELTEMGDAMERPILALYSKRRNVELTFPGTLLDPDEPFLGATPDGIANGERGVQCKFVGFRQAHRWGDELQGADGIPPEVLLQVHWEARAIRRTLEIHVDFEEVVAAIGTDLRVYEVPVDWELVERLEAIARSFWTDHVIPKAMPEVEDWSDENAMRVIRALHPTRASSKLEAMPEGVEKLCREYGSQRTIASVAEKKKKALAAQICAAIGSGAGFQKGSMTAEWSAPSKGKPSWKQIAYAAGATKNLIEKHTSPGERRLNVVIKDEE